MRVVSLRVHTVLSHVRVHFSELAALGVQLAATRELRPGGLLRALRHCDADAPITLAWGRVRLPISSGIPNTLYQLALAPPNVATP
jgi:hypothetical protein